jgi:endonuclease YncB( thermonuclease family)
MVASLAAAGVWGYGKLMPPEPPLAGRASVLSADTIRIGRTAVRLTGIAAPEAAQRCGEGRRRWSCGSSARRALASLADGRKVSCVIDSRQSEQAATGRCSVGGKDIGSKLVRDGHVWVDRYDSAGYRNVESEAREEKAGIWRSPSPPPWEWRDQLWAEAKKEAPDGCPIKAERTRRAQVYHMPWEPGYERLRITKSAERRGTRRWFCSEEEAIQAGFKPADASG